MNVVVEEVPYADVTWYRVGGGMIDVKLQEGAIQKKVVSKLLKDLVTFFIEVRCVDKTFFYINGHTLPIFYIQFFLNS